MVRTNIELANMNGFAYAAPQHGVYLHRYMRPQYSAAIFSRNTEPEAVVRHMGLHP